MVIAAFLTKVSEFGRLKLDICIEVMFWLHGAILKKSNFYEMANLKHDVTDRSSNEKLQTGGI